MRSAFALLVLGVSLLWLQGALALVVSPRLTPDLALLAVIALGLRWRGLSSGLGMAAFLGYATDLLSGSLLGQHALLRLGVFLAARLASRQLNLRGPLPLAVFAGGVSLAYGLAALALTEFFVPGTGVGASGLIGGLGHALVNAILAPFVSAAVERVAALAGEDDAGRRPLRLEPRGRLP